MPEEAKQIHAITIKQPWTITFVAEGFVPLIEQGFLKSILEGDEDVDD